MEGQRHFDCHTKRVTAAALGQELSQEPISLGMRLTGEQKFYIPGPAAARPLQRSVLHRKEYLDRTRARGRISPLEPELAIFALPTVVLLDRADPIRQIGQRAKGEIEFE